MGEGKSKQPASAAAAAAAAAAASASASARPPWKTAVFFVLDQWLLIGIGIVCVLAYFFPGVAKTHGHIRAEYSILYGAIAVIFVVSGLSIPQEKLYVHVRNWRLHLVVQLTSYLVVPAVVTAIVRAVLAGDPGGAVIDHSVLAGYTLLGCLPTTIASNVVMTRAAGGDEAAAIVEVLVGNVLGPFLSPMWTVALLPRASSFDVFRSRGDLGHMYRDVFQHLGLSMLVPLSAGLAVRWLWPEPTARCLQRLYMNKISTFCLLLVIWSTFSTCFATDALKSLTGSCIAFVVLFNVALYLFLTGLSFAIARLPGLHRPSPDATGRRALLRRRLVYRFEPRQAIAVCFCAPAKSTAVGMPMLFSMWAAVPVFLQAKASVPVLLYTTEQVFVAHFLVHVFKRWQARVDGKDESEEEVRVDQMDVVDRV